MKIYTKNGDRGLTALFNGQIVPKHHLRLQAYGTLDELNSLLGVSGAQCPHADIKAQLIKLQQSIMVLSSDLATPLGASNEAKIRRIGPADVAWLEEQIDAATAQLPPLKHFIIPSGGLTATHLHVARAVCRRAERHISELMQETSVGDHPLIFVNRLSDLLFTLARLVNHYEIIDNLEWHI